ncbi:MAG: glycosyltransferase family 2 protein [Bacillus sp. (in: firmicutes)]
MVEGKMVMIHFSFLVPVYNVEKYLSKCMYSLLAQNDAEYEILLIDDGSTDRSGELCDKFKEEYPDIVRVIHKENEGLLLTRRRGFKEAKGEWFICVDSDDYVEPNLLSTVMAIIQRHACDMVMYNFDYVDDLERHSASRLDIPDETVFHGTTKKAIYERRLLSVDVNSMCMRAIHRDLIDIDVDYSQCGIRNMCEDAVQNLAVYTNAKKIVYTSKPLYHYRKGQSSITAKRSLDSWIASKKCYEITESYLEIWNVPTEIRIKYYTQACELVTNFARWLIAEGNEEQIHTCIGILRENDNFKKCCDKLNKNYISTRYMRFSVPKVLKYIQMGNTTVLRVFFNFERILRSVI